MIKNIEVKNFKAIERGKVKLTPLTAFIGYNGTGKSSMIEALEAFQMVVVEGLSKLVIRWKKFDHIYYKGKKKKIRIKFPGNNNLLLSPMEFSFNTIINNQKTFFSSSIAQDETSIGHIYFFEEEIRYKNFLGVRKFDSFDFPEKFMKLPQPEYSIMNFNKEVFNYIERWQFLTMNTFLMGNAYPQRKTGGEIKLNNDGSNIAEYVLDIRDKSPKVFQGIIETMQYVLPYASDIQPVITQELENLVYMQLTEQDFKLPGWLLSTGTLKVLALLAVFRNPNPSPLIVIEELENGLDPRTINLIIGEIDEFVKQNDSQVIITTHSPYLLDLLHLSHIVFVERKENKVVFKRPYDDNELRKWSKDYTPGELYEKDLLQQYLSK